MATLHCLPQSIRATPLSSLSQKKCPSRKRSPCALLALRLSGRRPAHHLSLKNQTSVHSSTHSPYNPWPTAHFSGVAHKLKGLIPHGVILNQYENPNNPLAHEFGTGLEIVEAIVSTPSTPSRPSSEKVDVFIAGAGTGGTLTGVSRAVKKHNKDGLIIGIDPVSQSDSHVIFLTFPTEREYYGFAQKLERFRGRRVIIIPGRRNRVRGILFCKHLLIMLV